MKLLPLAALALSATALAAPAFATTFVGAQISVDARASLGADPSPGDPKHTDLAFIPTTESLDSRFDTARDFDRITVLNLISATWTSADAGSVAVHNAWDIDLVNPDITAAQASASPVRAGNPDWSYTFTAVADGVFAMDFAIAKTGDVLGLGFWSASVHEGGSVLKDTVLAPVLNDPATTIGTFTQGLLAGHTYTVAVTGQDSLGAFGTIAGQHFVGADDDTFSWTITSVAADVPEPSTWALMLAGFGLLGSTLRRRRVAALA